MHKVPPEFIQRTISLLGEGERRAVEIDIGVARFAPDKLTVRRLVDWIPEAFGYVLLPHVADLVLPRTFTAQAKDGTWQEFGFDREPIFAEATKIATDMYRDGPRAVFSNVAKRSTMLDAVNSTLNAGKSVRGIVVTGPALSGIPAEFYDVKAKPAATSLWRKLVG